MMRSGKRVFRYPYGTYTPVISDGRRIYLTGYSSINALEPIKPKMKVLPAHVARAPKPQHPKESAKRRKAKPAAKGQQAPKPAHHRRQAHHARAKAKQQAQGGKSGNGSK
jgi:hypothetical protein